MAYSIVKFLLGLQKANGSSKYSVVGEKFPQPLLRREKGMRFQARSLCMGNLSKTRS